MEDPSPESIARYARRNASSARQALKAVHAHHAPESIRQADYKGHRIVIGTTYRIEVDGKPIGGHFIVTDAGEVQCHAMPNYSFTSAIDLVKSMIEVFPDDFPEGGQGGHRTHGGAGRGGGGHSPTVSARRG